MEEKNTGKKILVLDEPYWFGGWKMGLEHRFKCRVEVADGVPEARAFLEGDSYILAVLEPFGIAPKSFRGLLDDLKERRIPVVILSSQGEEDLQTEFGLVPGEDYAKHFRKLEQDVSTLYDKLGRFL